MKHYFLLFFSLRIINEFWITIQASCSFSYLYQSRSKQEGHTYVASSNGPESEETELLTWLITP